MITSRTFVVATVLFLIMPSVVFSQNAAESINNLYFVSVAYPESFDDSADLFVAVVEERAMILGCLAPLRNTYMAMGAAAIEQCQSAHGAGTEAYWNCIKNDPSASMAFWANDLALLLDEKVNSWLDTHTGQTMMTAKQLMEAFQPGLWVQSIQAGMPMIRQMIVCP